MIIDEKSFVTIQSSGSVTDSTKSDSAFVFIYDGTLSCVFNETPCPKSASVLGVGIDLRVVFITLGTVVHVGLNDLSIACVASPTALENWMSGFNVIS